MKHRCSYCILLLATLVLASGCGVSNPIKRDPANAFPGTDAYDKRVASFKVTPAQAYRIAYDQARADNQLQYISKRPNVIAKRWYVFSVPLPSGASLQGYHVNGDNGEVKFYNEKKTVPQGKR